MSTGTATPATPITVHALPQWLVAAVALVAIVAIGVAGHVAIEHIHPKPPAPVVPVDPVKPEPQPQPKPEPKPEPAPDLTPLSVVSGLFTPTAVPTIQATPDAPAAPLGMFVLDASKSKSTRPIKWKVHGPAPLDLITLTRDGSPGSSLVLAYPTKPGTYRFHAISRGVTRGEPDADAATWSGTIGATPPDPNGPNPPTPRPDVPPAPIPPDADPAFVKIGETYRATLAGDYADAFEAGAKLLESGQPFSTALAQVAQEWGASRVASYDKVLTPAFGKILAESTPDAGVTPAQRAAMARAWHGFASGLRRP